MWDLFKGRVATGRFASSSSSAVNDDVSMGEDSGEDCSEDSEPGDDSHREPRLPRGSEFAFHLLVMFL